MLNGAILYLCILVFEFYLKFADIIKFDVIFYEKSLILLYFE